MRYLLLVGLGGGLGSMARYLCQRWMAIYYPHSFPFGTFIVNITGCFLIGLLWGLSLRPNGLNEGWRLFFMTGICGGFTTFSAFSMESLQLLRAEKTGLFMLYVVCSVILGLVATLAAFRLTQS
ncbi:fluoride efflux transporter CrcB [Nostoc ellipsosporum NOK]|jgi:CrcB protein|nr:fluoride efflux transporter CrcB [Nostoc ellipsosporum NOK]